MDLSRSVVAAEEALLRAGDIHRTELAVSTRPDELEAEEFDSAHESLAHRDRHANSSFSDWRVDELHLLAFGCVSASIDTRFGLGILSNLYSPSRSLVTPHAWCVLDSEYIGYDRA